VVTESGGFSAEAATLLAAVGDVTLADLDRGGLVRAARDADVLWVRLRHRIDAEVLGAGAHLQAVVTPTTGLNHVDLGEAARRGVRVLSLRGETEFLRDVRATAEHTVGLLLALLRRLPAAAAHVRDGGWDRDLFKGGEIYGKTAGIVGYGRLGRRVAHYLRAFDARVLASDPNVVAADVEPGVRLVPLAELLPAADVVLLHASYGETTHRFFGWEQFTAMKHGAWFVNTARGELVDEDALLWSLERGRLAGAALDVLAGERSAGMRDHPLVAYARSHDNLVVTPHVGGCTAESMEKTETFLARKLRAELLTRTALTNS
jgi:D-3-phosphoglycerate dehydrogenase